MSHFSFITKTGLRLPTTGIYFRPQEVGIETFEMYNAHLKDRIFSAALSV